VRPYGQHFLHDHNLLKKIISLSGLRSGDQVLEIGPGDGALTSYLLEAGCKVVAVEIDDKLEDTLRKKFDNNKNFRLIMGDALASKHQLSSQLLSVLAELGSYAFVSNLPYAAGTPILLNLWQSDYPPESSLVMLQKEVGERITAKVGTKAYGTITVLLANVAHNQYVSKVPPACFSPPPKVDSCLVHSQRCDTQVAPRSLQTLVQLAFSQRRKQIGKRLSEQGYLLDKCGIKGSDRAENMTPEQYFCLVRHKLS